MKKLRSLEPNHAVTDHRYRSQLKRTSDAVQSVCPSDAKRALTESVKDRDDVCLSSSEYTVNTATLSPSVESRIPLPLLDSSSEAQYRAQRTEEATTLVWNCDTLKCDEPLQLRLPTLNKQRTLTEQPKQSPSVQLADGSKRTCRSSENNAFMALVEAYELSDTEEQEEHRTVTAQLH